MQIWPRKEILKIYTWYTGIWNEKKVLGKFMENLKFTLYFLLFQRFILHFYAFPTRSLKTRIELKRAVAKVSNSEQKKES